jgi:hypothetical protein
MTTYKPIPEEILDYISYEPETGICRWKKRSANSVKVGDVTGSANTCGHLQIRFRKSSYLLHRVAWYLHYGKDPGDMEIDHRNGNRSDNRISNLRLVTHQQNQHNTKALGITYNKRQGKWHAKIKLDGKRIHLGTYDCPLLAGLAYQDAKKKYHPTALR